MASRKSVSIDFAFFQQLWHFYDSNRGTIRRHYRELTRKYLDYNDPTNAGAFLRQPQFEALEIYILLKEFLDNKPVADLFKAWSKKESKFAERTSGTVRPSGQTSLFDFVTQDQYDEIFAAMRSQKRIYPNYIFALTMGTGKTILMATCIFYEFILANKFPRDEKYCHNALLFAPDTTVLQSLREIQTMDKRLVVPPEYLNWLEANIKFYFLEETGASLDIIDRSRYNVIISNTQKIILKRQHKEKTPLERLLNSGKPTFQAGSIYDQFADLYELDTPEDEGELTTNQRFEKLRRLEQLGVFVDEAHHAFGTNLARDVGAQKDTRQTSLRNSIDLLAQSLKQSGTRVVACFNFTGTPYVGQQVLPEVVYAFGLQEAIDKEFLKRVRINGYTNPKSAEFIELAIDDFLSHNDLEDRHEGLRPKIAFFASTIKELQTELRPAIEAALAKRSIPTSKILVNVGDDKLTTSEDIREFNRLDTPDSDKQFILLVNKGREGWNCRSLFGVGLYRKPKSKIFVLQATMRCLRIIGEGQPTGNVYLSQENVKILDDELQQNFRVSLEDVQSTGADRIQVKIRVNLPPVKIKLKRRRHRYDVREKALLPGTSLGLDRYDKEKYRLLHTMRNSLRPDDRRASTRDISHLREQYTYTPMTLTAEIARYLNKSPLVIEEILASTAEGMERVVSAVNEFNKILYDLVIPRLFAELYEVQEYTRDEEFEVELIKQPKEDFYTVSAKQELVVREMDLPASKKSAKSFHVDAYCFDSSPEQRLFWDLVYDGRVTELYFTGMFTHGQSDFYVQYIDPDSHTIRSYYPDFLIKKDDGSYVIIEVKGDNKIEDPVVLAKQTFAQQMASASNMTYKMINGSDAGNGRYGELFSKL
jgi:type III restriction enzyme